MKNSKYRKYWLLSLAAVIAASVYPLYMGICVIYKMVQNGAVPLEDYPQYVIPYTPIACAVIIGVLLIPLLQRLSGKLDVLLGGYSPAFKIHFYLISVVIIVSLLNCFYGFAKMIRFGKTGRKKH